MFCLPGCTCELSKLPPEFAPIDELPISAATRSMESVSARTLIRVPNAVEQRDSIVINFL